MALINEIKDYQNFSLRNKGFEKLPATEKFDLLKEMYILESSIDTLMWVTGATNNLGDWIHEREEMLHMRQNTESGEDGR